MKTHGTMILAKELRPEPQIVGNYSERNVAAIPASRPSTGSTEMPEVELEYAGDDEIYADWYRCKSCGCEEILSRFNYCPNCGGHIAGKGVAFP